MGEQNRPAPKDDPCSIFFLGVDLKFFLRGEGLVGIFFRKTPLRTHLICRLAPFGEHRGELAPSRQILESTLMHQLIYPQSLMRMIISENNSNGPEVTGYKKNMVNSAEHEILSFISMINTRSERLEARNFICQYFSFYEQFKFRAQLS